VLVEAARIVTEQLSSVHFVVIGDAGSADKPYKRALVDRIQKYRMVSTWHWLGFRSNPQALLADVDIVALPSRREAFSLVPLEAGIGCKPVVASDVGGIPETIVDRVTGRLVLPGDPRLLADVIVELLKSPDQAEALGKAAGERVRQKFNPELYFQKFQSVYKAIVDEQ
jgi:glycosyltransferase involved in cell wall biosynthesis